MTYIDRETLIYPSVLGGSKPGDPMGPKQAPAFAEFVTNNQDTVLRGWVYWYVPEPKTHCPRHGGEWGDDTTCPNCTDLDGNPRKQVTEPVLIIEMDDEDTGPDITNIKVRVRRNDGMVYEGTRSDQVNLEEVD